MANKELEDYIQKRLKQGASRESITGELKNSGWNDADILAGFTVTPSGTSNAGVSNLSGVSGSDGGASAAIIREEKSVGAGVQRGWTFLVESLTFLFKNPIFLVPLFIAWILTASVTLYLRYYFVAPESLGLLLLSLFGAVFAVTFSISIANIMMLELMQQLEKKEEISFEKALKEAFVLDLLKVIPVAFLWAIVWFVLIVIRAITSKRKERSNRSELSTRDAALTLGGGNSGPFSWLKLGLRLFEKLMRMYIFLALPAIAWENKGAFSALKHSAQIIKKHPFEFMTSYTLTGIVSILMSIPLIIIFTFDGNGTVFPDIVWTAVIAYEGVIWTLGIYLEQMSVGLLYLWHLKWEQQGTQGDLSEVPKPRLMN